MMRKNHWRIAAWTSDNNYSHEVDRAFFTRRAAVRHARRNFPHAVIYQRHSEREVVF